MVQDRDSQALVGSCYIVVKKDFVEERHLSFSDGFVFSGECISLNIE